MMNALDHVKSISEYLENIQRLCLSELSKNTQKRLREIVTQALHSTSTICELIARVVDKRTVLAHQHLSFEGHLEKCTQVQTGKTTIRSSVRHAKDIRKRKLAEIDPGQNAELLSALQDLFQSGRLSRPLDVCDVIHGDNTKKQKQKRSSIIKILSQYFNIAKEKVLRNTYTKYKKFLLDNGPALRDRFGSRRPPLMPTPEFVAKLKEKLHCDQHKQKDLRVLTSEVLTKHKQDQHVADKKSGIIKVRPSEFSVDIYLRMATRLCADDIDHIGKSRHSTKARDTAIRSFRGVSSFIAVVLASQSYPNPDPVSNITYKGERDIRSLFPYPDKWVHPSLIINTDETLLKNKKGPPKWVEVSKTFREAKRKRFTQYTTEPDPQQVVCRIRLITTSNTDGEEAPLLSLSQN